MICQPVSPCCCDPWQIGQGNTLPLYIDWSTFLASAAGFLGVQAVKTITLKDYNVNPPVDADPADIALVSGFATDPDPPPTPGYTQILQGNTVTMNMVKAGVDVAIGNLYRLDIAIISRDCAGRELVLNYCVAINIVQC